jgi:hypothetical protein
MACAGGRILFSQATGLMLAALVLQLPQLFGCKRSRLP